MNQLPPGFDEVRGVLQEIDVVWVKRGSGGLAAAYEIEHSTPIYSGLLRLNDVRLINPHIDRLTVVSDEIRRAAFMRQLNRPTFNASSLSSVCSFLDYREVHDWHRRLVTEGTGGPVALSSKTKH
jgi:type II restriction enzyme